ncbi:MULTISPECIES: ogr/Delta-like zinc finger family protein [Dickeya]|uniref:ogr/Delta-like zinc finger family protein n=1 Tax=Dickeya TaxID=204037 RepID=UPI00118125C0|nr:MULTISPECIES: ogr/Delta-like zinc finger family protein [Dickeya]TYL43727.1 late control protein B [Dickeya sp. ws52]UAY94990.1 ogr/Delta-like zinc finger family protein [Dickeya dadantii]
MMRCPLCGQAAHTRSSHEVTSHTKERYNQCTNINCGHTFITMETFIRSIVVPASINSVPQHPKANGQTVLNF